ncbi:MAG: alkaline phosphatase family protein [Promethearchaeota archaeon]
MTDQPRVGIAKHVILIIVDDVSAEQFFRLYDEGKLPNIKELGDRGIVCENCVTTFPSITLPTQSNIMTGSYSGYYPISGSGIPTYHWFDRTADPPQYHHYSGVNVTGMTDDIGPNVRTIFEQISEGNSYSIAQLCSRGVTKVFPRNKISGLIQYFFHSLKKDRIKSFHTLITDKIINVFKNPKKYFKDGKKPIAVTVLYPYTDTLMHEFGFDSEPYINSVLDINVYIGELIQILKEIGIFSDTLIAITSDHGNYKAEGTGDLTPFFEKKGLVPYSNKTGRGDFDVAFGSLGFFNFRGKTWNVHPTTEELKNFKPTNGDETVNLIDMMFEIEGVKFVYFRSDENTPERGKIHILKKEKNQVFKAAIEYKADKTKYTFGDLDVFGYSDDILAVKMLDKEYHTIEEWLEHTYHLDFPMIVDQIIRYFKNPRSCDILVSTVGKICYNYEHGHGKTIGDGVFSHDVGLKCSMLVPLVIGGSSYIQSKKIEYCKTTDIVPTLLDSLGITPHNSVVGKSLLGLNQI